MLRIFRHAREGALTERDFGRFTRYALGEIVLVVIGILIALQIDNWNDERIEQREIREYALNLAADIARDLEAITPVEEQIDAVRHEAELFSDYARDRTLEDFDNAEVYFLTRRSRGHRPWEWHRAAIEELKASGGLRKMRNRRLAELISAYDALTRHLDEDYENDREGFRAATALVARVRDGNYENKDAVTAWQRSLPDLQTYYARYRDSEVFAQLQAQQRPLLVTDIVELRRLVNVLEDSTRGLRSRTESELPRLREIAAEIQALIVQEYGEP